MKNLTKNLVGVAVIATAVVAYRAYRKTRPLTESYVNSFNRSLYGSPDAEIQRHLLLDRRSGRA
jgi:hypothetical protein